MTETPLLEIKDLQRRLPHRQEEVLTAVDGANLTIYPGQTIAIVGESGSGKSTLAHAVIDLLPGTGQVMGGEILFEGHDIRHADRKARSSRCAARRSASCRRTRCPTSTRCGRSAARSRKRWSPTASPRATRPTSGSSSCSRRPGCRTPSVGPGSIPHEFSGGMRQRALIAMGLAARPKLLIADEPTSALDVTVQKQILDHLDQLTDTLGVAVMLITHDLGLAAERADHLVVMYRGRVVESGPAREHPAESRAPLHQAARVQGAVAGVAAAVVRTRPCRGARAGRPDRGRDRRGDRAQRRRVRRGPQRTSSSSRTSPRSSRCVAPSRGRRSTSPRSTTSRSGCAAAPPRRSWGSPARASRPSPAWCSTCCRRPRAT